MAEVKKASPQTIDKLLDLSWSSWEELPSVASEIDDWAFDDQITYAAEWPLEEDRLVLLKEYEESSFMTEAQLRKHRLLKVLVARNRPLLEDVLRG